MLTRLRFAGRQIAHDLSAGLLLRPGLFTVVLGVGGAGLALAEQRSPGFASLVQRLPLVAEPATAQLVLASIAGSMMTVVAVVYSVLIMALTLASLQFSPRIMTGLMRDASSQTTLGMFIGTFTYCLVVLPAVRVDPAFVPRLAVTFAICLALASLGVLVYFIHHIAQVIQVNHLSDRIAREAEDVIDEVFTRDRAPGEPDDGVVPFAVDGASAIRAPASGYVQLIDEEALGALAAAGVALSVTRALGDFVVHGATIAHVRSATGGVSEETRAAVEAAFDIGPLRTMQRDVEFGIRQLVDISLKAISPAVNDPSTAVTCIDHLARLLARLATRKAPPVPQGLRLRRATFVSALDLAFNQIRQYGRSDLAVSQRMLRALQDVADVATVPAHLERILFHGRLVAAACADFPESDRDVLRERLAALEAVVRSSAAPSSAA